LGLEKGLQGGDERLIDFRPVRKSELLTGEVIKKGTVEPPSRWWKIP